jgi:CNT family concentrative nucleoside transporter
MSVLYHLRVMPWVVKIVGGGLRAVLGTQRAESLNAAANIFIGGTEAPLVVRPHLARLTQEQLFAVMVSGLASVSGTVLAAYVLMGAQIEYLLAATVMSAPGGLLMAKILMPDTVQESGVISDPHVSVEASRQENVLMAAAVGTMDGVKLAVYIGGMLISFVALIALFNSVVGGLGELVGIDGLSMQRILGWVFSPIMFLLSIPWEESFTAGALFGEKLVLNEFVAFSHLSEYMNGSSERVIAIVTFSLCGFANFAAIAILLGGLGSLIPDKRELIARNGMRAVFAASLSNLLSAAFAGLLIAA